MKAIVLAGGLGTRLRSAFSGGPKPMALINGTPFLSILLRHLRSLGLSEIILSVGYKSQMISDFYRNEFEGMRLQYCLEEEALGTGGAILKSLLHSKESPVLVLNGDTFVEFSLEAARQAWQKYGTPVIFARRVTEVSRFGRIEVKNHLAVRFEVEGSPGPGLVNAGVYLLPRDLFEGQNLSENFSFEDFLASDILNRPYFVSETSGEFIDIGTPEDFERAQSILG
jgi:D-glycero-alpha-D-manno-heptose 1-phosphate guanylyltransferase